jgi:hypothetical protein
MEHKAYAFDDEAFRQELAPLLDNALQTGDVDPLIAFVDDNRTRVTDPYEGAPLEDGWLDMVETRDAHQVGDFALTAYYDVKADVGLGYDWEAASDAVGEAVVLGEPFGPQDNPFDPGKMGSFFQSPQQVQDNLERVRAQGSGQDVVERVQRMLETAARDNSGLYVTF